MISSKRTGLRLVALVLAVVIFTGLTDGAGLFGRNAGLFAVRAEAADSNQLAGTERPVYYAREELKKQENADFLLMLYDMMLEAAAKNEKEADGWIYVNLYENGYTDVNVAITSAVYNAFIADHPEFYWLGNTYGNSTYEEDKCYAFVMSSDDELFAKKSTFDAAVKKIISDAGVTAGMSDFEKAERIHDELAKNIVYNNAANAHNPYGAVVDKVCVCEGYAEAYQYLLQCCGIQSLRVEGESFNSAKGAMEAHAWNLVRLDGKYYYTDLTWDDQGTETYELYHNYLNVTKEFISADHIFADTIMYTLPEANSTELNYFTVHGGVMPANNLDVDYLTDSFLEKGYAIVSVTGDNYDENLQVCFGENIGTILQNIGATKGSRSYSMSHLGREYHLYVITPCGNLRDAAHTDSNKDGKCDVCGFFLPVAECPHTDLTKTSAKEATCIEEGNNEYYTCVCGKIFKKDKVTETTVQAEKIPVNKNNHVGQTEIKNAKEATEEEDGYTGDIYCKSCGQKKSDGQTIPKIVVDYTVTFKDDNGTVISSEIYHYGDVIIEPAAPEKEADKTYTYSFTGWDKTVVKCTGDATYTATYSKAYINYTVTFLNDDNSVLSTGWYHYGEEVAEPLSPSKDSDGVYDYVFAGWDKPVGNCTGNTTYVAKFNAEKRVMLGDLTGDSSVSADDLTLLARHVAKIQEITDSTYLLAADVNCDGVVDASDLTMLARYVAKIISELGPA